ncbi:MAG: hypothetical protein M5U28_26035 [Sandaracinaceae bacterium]|nr:hypothetical protein [Sandaracinaceae bacterium]
MMEDLFAWLQRSEGPLAYLVLAAANAIEYVFPPFPGDSITLFGIALAAGSGYGLAWVYVALNLGALGGGMTTYAIGRWIAERREHRTPRFLRGQQDAPRHRHRARALRAARRRPPRHQPLRARAAQRVSSWRPAWRASRPGRSPSSARSPRWPGTRFSSPAAGRSARTTRSSRDGSARTATSRSARWASRSSSSGCAGTSGAAASARE